MQAGFMVRDALALLALLTMRFEKNYFALFRRC